MKRFSILLTATIVACSLSAQTLNVKVGNVTYLFPASQAGVMTYSDGSSLTVMGKTFTLNKVSSMYVDETAVTDDAVSVVYSGSSASITIAGSVAQYLTITQSGAHVSIVQSSDLAQEITYTLSGSSSDGGFYMEGSYKATVELNGLNLTNSSAVYSGAAVHIQNGKRIKVKPLNGTTNTLTDAASGSQKGCLYVKGHIEFAQSGTLNVYGNTKHAIKAGEYVTIKNATINVLSAAGDGLNCEQYFLMASGTLNISGVSDDGIQCDIEDTDTGSTGETADHEDEDSGNMYLQGGTINVNVTATAAKGIKAEGNISISGGTIGVTTTGSGEWDSDDLETKSACGISSDANITISAGTITLKSTGSGGKGLKCDTLLTISGSAVIDVTTTGGLYYNNGTKEYTNYTGNTDNVDSDYYSSPKGIKAGTKVEAGKQNNKTTYNYYGGIVISGSTITVSTSGTNGEGIESKSTLVISGGEIAVNAYDDAINAASDLTISNGYVYARATNNDAIDANGNCYIQGGLVYAIGASGAEVAIDANSEDQKQLYVSGGTLVAIGGLEKGASLTQTCYSASWSQNTWYALTVGNNVFAFKTPSSGGTGMVVSGASTPTLKSGITASGTSIFGGVAYYPATVSGGSNVSLSSYSGGNTGGGNFPGGGNNPGGGGFWH
ncbi:MAG: carbohydrate-binding domain-containing protein [Paludibacteraceae bacterium]|nr:carbohydrate-binding domain-containing protein [Paludibacteraceae bacterium]